MTDRWSPALEKNAARRRVRLSAKARGAVAGRGGGGGGADKPLEGGGGHDRRSGGGSGSLQKRAVRWRRGGGFGSLQKRASRQRMGGGMTDVGGGVGGGEADRPLEGGGG